MPSIHIAREFPEDILAGVYQPHIQFAISNTVGLPNIHPISAQIHEELAAAQRRQLEIMLFSRWANRHREQQASGSLSTQEMEALRRDKPFFAAILDGRNDPIRDYWRDRRLTRIRQRILGRDRRWENRKRKECSPYLNSYQAQVRFDSHWRQALALRTAKKPKNPFQGRQLPSERELLEQLEADLAVINQDLEEEGQPKAAQGEFRCKPCLTWRVDVSEIEDQHGDCHDLGAYTVHLMADGSVYGFGGDHERKGYCHPHLSSDGSMCKGDYQNFKDLLCTSGALAAVFDNVNRLLNTYNHESPYIELLDLVDENAGYCCTKCGDEVDEDEVYWSGDDTYCGECTWSCDSCERTYVNGDDESTEARGRYYCEDCAAEHLHQCEGCEEYFEDDDVNYIENGRGDGAYYCSSCSTTCYDCREAVVKDDAIRLNGHYYCEDCVTSCEDCDKDIPKGEAESWDEDGGSLELCSECYEKREQAAEEAEEDKDDDEQNQETEPASAADRLD